MRNHRKNTVLITGGTGSVGQALIRAFHKAGFSVAFQFHTNQKRAKHLAKQYGASPIQFDLSATFHLPTSDFDVLVNNAGVNLSDHRTDNCTDEEFLHTVAVNLVAPFRLIRSLLPHMKSQHWGRIINISSIYGLRAVEGNCPYTVSKHGLSGLTKTVAKEYAEFGITSNEICPGPIEGELMDRIAQRAFMSSFASPKEYLRAVAKEVPAKRLAKPEEIAALAVFLASNDSAYLNGASIPVDGGIIA